MFLLFTDWFSGPVAKAIGWTLVHSLWQGLLLTLLAGILIIFTRRSAASLRYRLLSFLLIGFIAGACVTFILEWQATKKMADSRQLAVSSRQTGISLSGEEPAVINYNSQTISFLDRLTDYFNSNTSLIVAIWFLIFLFKCIRLTAHIGYAQRLRHYKCNTLPGWQKRVQELAALLKVKTGIAVRESSIIKAPSVIGLVKPVILLPVGLIARLPIDQVEAILLHELAHIRRKDYLVNILQCMAETGFFFNPSVLWLSSLIREERENCCDDMAIAINGNRSSYVHALVAFQEYSAEPVYATAFPGNKYPVLKRVRRIICNNNKNLSNMEKVFLASGLVLSAVLVLVFSTSSAQSPAAINQPALQKVNTVEPVAPVSNQQAVKDSPPGQQLKKENFTGTVTAYEEGKEYTLIVKDNEIRGLFINSEKVPDEKIGDYKQVADRLIKMHKDKGNQVNREYEKMRQAVAKQNETNKKSNLFQSNESNLFRKKQERKETDQDIKIEEEKWKIQSDQEFNIKTEELQWKQQQNERKQQLNKAEIQLSENNVQISKRDQLSESTRQYHKDIFYQFQKIEKSANDRQHHINELEMLINEYQQSLEKEGVGRDEIRQMVSIYKERVIRLKNSGKERIRVNDNPKPRNVTVHADKPEKPRISKDPVRIHKPREKKDLVQPNNPSIPAVEKAVQPIIENEVTKQINRSNIKNEIINDLREADVLPEKGLTVISLNFYALRINGKKKNKDLHEKLRNKYIKGPSDSIFFSF